MYILYRLLCSCVVCVGRSHSEVIPVIWKQLGSMSTTQKQSYFSLYELLRGLQDPVDGTIGKILLVFILACPDPLLYRFLLSLLLHFLIFCSSVQQLKPHHQTITMSQPPNFLIPENAAIAQSCCDLETCQQLGSILILACTNYLED